MNKIILTLFLFLAATVARASVAMPTTEADYLLQKGRVNLADPTTGYDNPEMGRRLAKLVSEWRQTRSWEETKATMFAWMCDHVAIDVSPLDWFPTFALWSRDEVKRAREIRELHPVMDIIRARDREVTETRLRGVKRDEPGAWFVYHDFDHAAPDWDDVLALGFPGMAARLERHVRDTSFYRTRRVAARAALRLVGRLAAQGEKARSGALSPVRAARLEKTVASLRRLERGAPLTALDAMNFIYVYWTMSEQFEAIQVRTLGNIDRLLTPYYRADLAAGRTTEAEFREQFRHFWWQWGTLDYYWGQPVYVGGTKADGTTEYTEVSRMMLEEIDAMALPTPKLHVKIGKSTPDWLWRQTLEMMRRQRSISFLGEESHWRVIRSMGYTAEQARTFLVWGCYEWALKDSANDTCGATVSLLHPVTTLLKEAAAGTYRAETFDRFAADYRRRVAALCDTAREGAVTNETVLAEVNPSMLFSLANGHAVASGRDGFADGTAHGNNSTVWTIGLGTSVDALLAVKELVYETRTLSLADLGRLMAANWRDREDLRLRMLRGKRKWGNNDAEANALAKTLVAVVAERVNGRPNSRGGVFKAMGHSAVRHIGMGRRTGATPDGRKAGEEFSKNISPTMGADTEGATALVESAGALDARQLPGDFPLDVALLPTSVAGEKGLQAMRTLIERYFALGGLVIQFNIVDASTLRDAQRHPERYANLQVRVCGWNVRWNEIPPVEQEKFILRQETAAGF